LTSASFLDANVPIYAAGGSHPLKSPCLEVLRLAAERPHAFVTDAEVLQELLHRYVAIKRWQQGREVLKRFTELMLGRIEPVAEQDVTMAAGMVDAGHAARNLSARDLLHAAIMKRLGVTRMVSADSGFDGLPGIQRLDPSKLPRWRPLIARRR
jgi:predicted nucleic acid-binding protein